MLKLPVYLDYNATTPIDLRVLEAMMPYLTEKFGNAASRNHAYGWVAADAVDMAREQIANLINAEPNEIVFTSGATEGDNLALKGVFEAYSTKGNHIITVATEHKAVLDTCKHLEKLGAAITYLPVNGDGLINLDELEKAITDKTILISVMYANNETGVIQPIKEIAAIAHKHGAIMMSDATQAAGKIPVMQARGYRPDDFSAHKIYGPKGIGALYVRRKNPRVSLIAQMDGGGHERGFRSGTLNVPAIVGFGKAAEIAKNEQEADACKLANLKQKLENGLLLIPNSRVLGNKKRVPNTCYIAFQNVDSEALISALNNDLAISSGSACSSATLEPSHVLQAMGLSAEEAHTAVRISLGRFTTEEEIIFVVEKITRAVVALRELSPT